jgi:hypothetical protein
MHEEDYAMNQQVPHTLIAGRSRTSPRPTWQRHLLGNNEVTSKESMSGGSGRYDLDQSASLGSPRDN